MPIWLAALLGLVQGLTEFLPVSSSGHLAILQHAAGLREPQILFDVVVHLGTLVAVCVFFARDLGRIIADTLRALGALGRRRPLAEVREAFPGAVTATWVVLATGVTAVLGLTFKGAIEAAFASLLAVGVFLLCTAAFLFASRFAPVGDRDEPRIGWRRALGIGLAQAVAILPGISRSGATITAGLFLGLRGEAAARFSFLLSIPAILGAAVLEGRHALGGAVDLAPLAVGFLVAAAVGFGALYLLMWVARGRRLWAFSFWCAAAGMVAIAMHAVGR